MTTKEKIPLELDEEISPAAARLLGISQGRGLPHLDWVKFAKKIIAFIVVLSVGIFIVYTLPKQTSPTNIVVDSEINPIEEYPPPANVTIIERENISFESFIFDNNRYDGKRAKIIGRLNRESREGFGAGVVENSIIDDYGNKIGLPYLKSEHSILIPSQGSTEEYYEIDGIFSKKYGGLDITIITMQVAS